MFIVEFFFKEKTYNELNRRLSLRAAQVGRVYPWFTEKKLNFNSIQKILMTRIEKQVVSLI